MYLPNIYEKFIERFPKISKDYEQLGLSCRSAGPLERKIQDLVKLADRLRSEPYDQGHFFP